jgi:hypothetical protein
MWTSGFKVIHQYRGGKTMSEIKTSPFKRPGCGNSSGGLRDFLGGVTDLQIVGTDPDVNVVAGSSITNGTGDYAPDAEHTNHGTFLICIEVAGVFYVTLADGTDFIITTVQSTTYLGDWVPMKLLSVNVGTTGSFSVGY